MLLFAKNSYLQICKLYKDLHEEKNKYVKRLMLISSCEKSINANASKKLVMIAAILVFRGGKGV